jgi:galactokinase
MKEKITQIYTEQFNEKPTACFFSPGRINIIGEHTDYNNGFVLPAAVDKGIYVAIGKNQTNTIHLYSVDYNELFSIDISSIKITQNRWANYVLGIVAQIIKANKNITGFNMVIDGDLPIGAGLSSSAALECAALFAINELFELNLNKLDIVQMAQKAEHEYAGVKCGIMDMFASVFGKKDYAIKLDCKTLDFEYVPLQFGDYAILLLNTNIKHSLASSAYNKRREECEQGVAWVAEKFTHVNSLRDVTIAMLNEIVLPKNKLVYTRCKFVVEEIQRLQDACIALDNNDISKLGQYMFATHYGLSKEYEVSCPELDFLEAKANGHNDIAGARMMGGGFGGCTINVVKSGAINQVIAQMSTAYKNEFNFDLSYYTVATSNGTHQLI